MQDSTSKKKVYCSMVESAFHFQQKLENSLPYHYARTPIHRLQEQLQLYQWRKQRKNNFIAFQWMQIEPFNDKEVTIVLKSMQKLTSLSNISKIKIYQFIKKMGKVFGSFKMLFERFGPFEVSQEMIAFDSFYQPVVWMNSDHIKNEYKRDFVSEQEFGQNILLLLLKCDSQFGVQGFAEHCCKVRGQKKTLQQLTSHFLEYKQKERIQKIRKVSNSSISSQECILSFSKISRTKKKNTIQHRSNKQICMSYLNTNENKSKDHIFFTNLSESKKQTESCDKKRNCSLISIKMPQDLDNSFCFEQIKMTEKITTFTDNTQKKPLTVSVNLDQQQSEEDLVKQIVQLPQLDQYKRCLVKSIINKDGKIKDNHF